MTSSESHPFCPKPPVFVREATGLIRGVSPFHALVTTLIITNYGVGMAAFYSYTPYLWAGADLGASAFFAIPFVLVNALLYVWFTEWMPRSGGDYVWIGRIVTPSIAVGFVFVYVFYQGIFWGSLVNYTVSYFLGSGFATMGFALGNPGLTASSAFFATNAAIIGLGTVIIVVMTGLLLIPMRHYLRYQLTLWILGMIAILISVLLYATSSHVTFVNTFNADFQSYNATYAGVISEASSLGLSNPGLVTFGTPTLFATAFMFISLNGYQFAAYFGGELKSVKKSMYAAAMLGGLISIVIYAIGGYTFQNVVGTTFVNALSYIEYAVPAHYTLPIPWNNFFFSMLLTNNPVLIVLMVIGLFAWGFSGLTAIGLACSRILMASGFDRSLPGKLATVSDRFHTPVFAVLIYGLVCEVGLITSVYAGLIFGALNITLVICGLYAFVGFVGVIFPYRRKDIFESSSLSKYRVGGVPAISLVGLANLILFGFLVYFSLENPAMSGPVGAPALITLGGIFVLGIIAYYATKLYYRKKGIDISLAMAQIPPE
jgi:amino acid transporter